MRFKGPSDRHDLDDLLSIPARNELRFQIVDQAPAAKTDQSLRELGENVAGLHAFCMADGTLEKMSAFDVDHVIPFKDIHDKQEALLNYLNDPSNRFFADAFLRIDRIAKYFGRDAQSGEIISRMLC